MKIKLIYTLLIVLGGVIVFIVLKDVFKSELDSTNPYALEMGDLREVESSLVKYKEIRRIKGSFPDPVALDYHAGLLAIAYKSRIQLIDTTGKEYFNQPVYDQTTSIAFGDEKIYVGFMDHIEVFGKDADKLESWDPLDSSSYLTSIVIKGDRVLAADAGNSRICIFNSKGKMIHSFDGKDKLGSELGFMIPSPYFDVAIDPENEIWIANTGLQCIENYSEEGAFRSYWGKASFTIEGFVGCCNPAQFTILSNGYFVTSEKGIVRIKVYNPSGELESVVAVPDDFDLDSEPPDLTADEDGKIYALDLTRNMIRIFERKVRNG